jgi:chromatin segregation and condensation protein Rec8/ScpA/Scc1 (kleisin family)
MGEPDPKPAVATIQKRPDYRFPFVDETTAEFRVTLPPFTDAAHGFSGTIKELLDALRSQRLLLEKVPLAPLVDQYLAFREALEPAEANERISDFLPLAATLIHLKSELFVRKPMVSDPAAPSPEEQLLDEIQRAERCRREERAPIQDTPTEPAGPARLTLLDLMVLLNDVRNSVRTSLTVEDEDLTVRDAMRWIRDTLPQQAALEAETYFEQCRNRSSETSVFLALLELSRHGLIDCHQADAFTPIWISRTIS